MRQLSIIKNDPVISDIVYTPNNVAKNIIDWLNPSVPCLDPCFGDGAFFNNMPKDSEWCEIEKGKDFFNYNKNVKWIIGNPPYSIFKDWLQHSFSIADEVAYILPTNKVFQRQIIMKMINSFGGIKNLWVYGSGSMVGFPFGFSVGTFHFSKNHKGPCNIKLGGI